MTDEPSRSVSGGPNVVLLSTMDAPPPSWIAPLLEPAPAVNVAPLPVTLIVPVLARPAPALRLPFARLMAPELVSTEPGVRLPAVPITFPALFRLLTLSVMWLSRIVPPVSFVIGTLIDAVPPVSLALIVP